MLPDPSVATNLTRLSDVSPDNFLHFPPSQTGLFRLDTIKYQTS